MPEDSKTDDTVAKCDVENADKSDAVVESDASKSDSAVSDVVESDVKKGEAVESDANKSDEAESDTKKIDAELNAASKNDVGASDATKSDEAKKSHVAESDAAEKESLLVLVPRLDFLLGIADLTGEMVRIWKNVCLSHVT